MAELSQENRILKVSTPLGDDALLLLSFRGKEHLSQLFQFELELLSDNPDLDVSSLLGNSVSFSVERSDETSQQFNGIVSRVSAGRVDATEDATYRIFHAEVVPEVWKLRLGKDSRVFQEQTPTDIIEQVLKDSGTTDYKLSTRGTYEKLDYCVQYQESNWQFIQRLAERFGLFYFFTYEGDKHTLVFADAASGTIDSVDNEVELQSAFAEDVAETLTSFERQLELVGGKVSVSHYDLEQPNELLVATEKTILKSGAESDGEYFEYPGGFATMADGKTLAVTRMEQEEARHEVVTGKGTYSGFSPGLKFKVTEHPVESEQNQVYTLTRVDHHATDPNFLFSSGSVGKTGEEQMPDYFNFFSGVPSKITPRPPRETPLPRIQGLQTAKVVGAKDQEILVDKYARIKVQFHWDREGKYDDKSSCWVRVAQTWAGNRWGAQFIPRVGQEVVVDFLEGDPDRPLVTGVVYNAEQMPPYDLPDDQTKSGIKTRSTTKGKDENFNELRFDDTIGKEEIFFQAERNFTRLVKNDDKLTVGLETKDAGDQIIEIQNSRTVTIHDADDTLKLDKGNTVVTVSKGDHSTAISQGDHSIKVTAGASEIVAGKSITLKVGASKIVIDTSGVVIEGMNVKITGTAQAKLSSPMTTVSGDGMVKVVGGLIKLN